VKDVLGVSASDRARIRDRGLLTVEAVSRLEIEEISRDVISLWLF